MIGKLEYGASVITYDVERVHRKTLGLYVHPDGSVLVKAPNSTTDDQICEKVHRRAAWILKQQHFFKSFGNGSLPKRYVGGESHLYLGRQYMLRVTQSETDSVHYQNNIIEISCQRREDAGELMKEWYRVRAHQKFAEYAKPLINRFERYGVQPSGLEIREMHTRWGSCTSQGKIILNVELIRAPKVCIEYVLIHELCHLVHRNHTKAYYELLDKEMPHWQRWKTRLEQIGPSIL